METRDHDGGLVSGLIRKEMPLAAGYTDVAASTPLNGQGERRGGRGGNGMKFAYCPYCSRKGLYKVPRSYERCRCCGLRRILLPGQDF